MDVDALVSEATARIADAADSAALEEISHRGPSAGGPARCRRCGSCRQLTARRAARARWTKLNRARERRSRGWSTAAPRELRGRELEERLRTDRVDVTLPGVVHPRGYSHLIEQTRRDILDVFVGFGYRL